MSGHSHHCARAVTHEDKIGGIDRYAVTADRVDGLQSGIHPEFFHGCHFRFCNFDLILFCDELSQLAICLGSFSGNRMLGSHCNIGDAHQSVRTGGVD